VANLIVESLESANQSIAKVLRSGDVFYISRAGAVEMLAIESNLIVGHLSRLRKIRRRFHLWKNAGVFPPTQRELRYFSSEYISAFANSDFHVNIPLDKSWAYLNEATKQQNPFPIEVLDPVLIASRGITPWSLELANKKVLVIHPEANLILSQSLYSGTLHSRPVLSFREINILRPPETNGFEIAVKSNWHKNLENFKLELGVMLEKNQPDLALVAAGAYGLPICSYLKKRGVSSIYMGGALQILFGIWGNRWRGNIEYESMATERWLHSGRSKVRGSKFIEKGAYW